MMYFNEISCVLILLIILNSCTQCWGGNRESCHSPIFCHGELLHTVQMSRIFADSKTFVDMSMINSVDKTLENFQAFMKRTHNKPSSNDIKVFVYENFVTVGELDEYHPDDFVAEPKLVKQLMHPSLKDFTKDVVAIWPTLARRTNTDVLYNPERFSFIPIYDGFIIPGGRFREIYYWDSLWILKGLLLSDMISTAKGMIKNLLSLVDRFGFVPCGTRIYYLNRSQPPMLTLMVAEYVKFTNDFEFLRDNSMLLDKELRFWLDHRMSRFTRNGTEYELAFFDSSSNTPRPESYYEDINTCKMYSDPDRKGACYQSLKGGAESGWDFSSRFIFDTNGLPTTNLSQLDVNRVLPVDLNSILCKSYRELAMFFQILRQNDLANFWMKKYEISLRGIEEILYDFKEGMWFDWDKRLGKRRKQFYPSNFAPLWADVVDDKLKEDRGGRAVAYLHRHKILEFPGGIPSSLLRSGEQWDFPNAWAPSQGMVIFGLERSGNKEAEEVAKRLATNWVKSNVKSFLDNEKVMFEKYDSVNFGTYGKGGEYQVQTGFGWSNGLVLELIDFYYRNEDIKGNYFD